LSKQPHITKPTHTHKDTHVTKQVKTTTVNEDFLTSLRGSVEEVAGQSQDIWPSKKCCEKQL